MSWGNNSRHCTVSARNTRTGQAATVHANGAAKHGVVRDMNALVDMYTSTAAATAQASSTGPFSQSLELASGDFRDWLFDGLPSDMPVLLPKVFKRLTVCSRAEAQRRHGARQETTAVAVIAVRDSLPSCRSVGYNACF